MTKMNIVKELILPVLIVGVFACCVASQDSQPDTDNSQRSLLKSLSNRYGKRPSGHSFVRFGKRADNKGHSYMYFGKKASPDDSNIADLLHYLQRSQEPSWKRGHSIMRFGKRSDRHNFIRFGKRDTTDNDVPVNDDDIDDEKRGGQHSMMYFGKRGGHSMMYFGKRGGHSMLYFGKRVPDIEDDYDKRGGHSMLYFGKRSPSMGEDFEKRGGHSMLYFGKRSPYTDDDDDDFEKRGGHSMLYFGKRSPYIDGNDDDEEKRGGHSMLYFGKRGPNSNNGYGKNGHSMMYFGKRDPYLYEDMDGYVGEIPEEEMNKRGPHSMIHFGKRDDDDSGKDGSNGKRAHSMIHFGKRSDDTDDSLSNFTNDEEKRAGHGMIHFGKRQQISDIVADDTWAHSISPFDLKSNEYNDLLKSDDDINLQKKDNKKSHMMIHFGKRSVENDKMTDEEQSMNSKIEENSELHDEDSGPQKTSGDKVNEKKTRTKREIEPSEVPLLPFSPFIAGYEGADPSEDSYSDYGYEYPLALNSIVPVRKIRSNGSPEKSKNVFLRFGKR